MWYPYGSVVGTILRYHIDEVPTIGWKIFAYICIYGIATCFEIMIFDYPKIQPGQVKLTLKRWYCTYIGHERGNYRCLHQKVLGLHQKSRLIQSGHISYSKCRWLLIIMKCFAIIGDIAKNDGRHFWNHSDTNRIRHGSPFNSESMYRE